MYSNDMKFLESHEWVRLESENSAKIGITHHAQELLGDLVYVELPKIGQQITSGDSIGVIESVKAASDLYSPVSGEITEINESVINEPNLVNSDPHNSGWLIKVKLSNSSELDNLLNLEQYQKSIG